MKVDQKLAHALRDLREQRGITQDGLAHAADVTTMALSRIEGGEANPTWIILAPFSRHRGSPWQSLKRYSCA